MGPVGTRRWEGCPPRAHVWDGAIWEKVGAGPKNEEAAGKRRKERLEEVAEEVRGIVAADAYAARIGAELVDIRPGWAKVVMRLDKEHLNFMGMVHGGVMFSLADVAFGAAANSFGTKAMALSVNVDYLAAPRVEGEMTAEVSLVARAGKMGCYDMEVKDAEGALVARCRGWAYHTGRPLREEGGEEGERREQPFQAKGRGGRRE